MLTLTIKNLYVEIHFWKWAWWFGFDDDAMFHTEPIFKAEKFWRFELDWQGEWSINLNFNKRQTINKKILK